MSWFTPKLEPGERVLFRYPDGRREGLHLLMLLAVLPIFAVYGLWVADLGMDYVILTGGFAYVVPLALIQGWRFRARAWRIMVTDRRILIRRERRQGEAIELPRDGIENVRRDAMNQRLILRVAGEEIAIPFDYEASEERLRRALDPHPPLEVSLGAPISRFLDPGEKIVLRHPTAGRRAFWAVLQPALILLAFIAPVFLLPSSPSIELVFLLPAAAVPFLILANTELQKHAWLVAVTDRRILHRDRGDFTLVESMDLKELAEISRETIMTKLILRGGDGQELAIRCDPEEAGRILAALGYDEAGA